jgi:ABC-type dipeptide/oligopeptide/nickel transport system permease component
MFRYVIIRILGASVLFFVITFAVFMAFFNGPSKAARAQCGGAQAQPTCIKLVSVHKPLYVMYARFLDRLVVHRSLSTQALR